MEITFDVDALYGTEFVVEHPAVAAIQVAIASSFIFFIIFTFVVKF